MFVLAQANRLCASAVLMRFFMQNKKDGRGVGGVSTCLEYFQARLESHQLFSSPRVTLSSKYLSGFSAQCEEKQHQAGF